MSGKFSNFLLGGERDGTPKNKVFKRKTFTDHVVSIELGYTSTQYQKANEGILKKNNILSFQQKKPNLISK